ncbi:hypothetical protein WJX77_003871 [Trebouxia sp. C0004]
MLFLAASTEQQVPLDSPATSRPVSAQLSQLSAVDPTGRGALLSAFGDPSMFIGKFPYAFSPEQLQAGVNATVDPAITNPILGNNPAVNGSFKIVGNTGAIAGHSIPFSNDLVLFLIRPNPRLDFGGPTTDIPTENYLLVDNGTRVESAAFYNLTDNTFKPFHIAEGALCSGHALLPDGSALIGGGMMVGMDAPYFQVGYQAVRVVDGINQNYSVVNEFPTGRWYPSVATLPDGNMLVVGGAQIEMIGWGTSQSPFGEGTPEDGSSTSTVQCTGYAGNQPSDPSYSTPTYAVFDSTTYRLSRQLTLSILLETWPINTYPFVTVLPSGSVLIIAGNQMEALFMPAEGASADNAIGSLPTLPYPVNFPQQGSMVLLPLEGPNYDTQVMIAGGSSEYCATAMSPASSMSLYVDVTPGANHSVVQEQMAFPRVMGDAVLLPDGTVFLCNGAQVGVGGGSGYGFSVANEATTIAEIYDPTKALGQRWSTVADSQIWRMYHSSAFLTSNAEVFIGGSETTAEYRAQIYTPSYLQNGKPRPYITSAPSSIDYNVGFSVGFSNTTSLDRVVLNRLASSTHGNHFDQRQIVLGCSTTGFSSSCLSPPNSSVAPPGQYQLFASFQGVPSKASIVTLNMAANTTDVDGNFGSGLPAAPSEATTSTPSIATTG